jgi:hypothetical protein
VLQQFNPFRVQQWKRVVIKIGLRPGGLLEGNSVRSEARHRPEASENSLLVLWAIMAPISYGLALIREGRVAEGIGAPSGRASRLWEAAGGKTRSPTWKAFLAEGLALTGDVNNALHSLDAVIRQIDPEYRLDAIRPRYRRAPAAGGSDHT